jgi:hypothetical protein
VIRLDSLTRRRDSPPKRESTGNIELLSADHEEPTWEVRPAGEKRRRRMDGRTRVILSVAAAIAVVANAGAAWVYWQITGSETGHRSSGTTVELALRARSDLNHPLFPGQTGNLTVTVTNDYDFPIRITLVTPGAGNIVADSEHRDRGCKDPKMRLAQEAFTVSWEVPRNTIGAFTIADALFMRRDADGACNGAVFTVPVQASGISRNAS